MQCSSPSAKLLYREEETGMHSQEYVDIFDTAMNYLGSASLDEVHAQGLWHQTFHCWLIKREEETYSLLFQRRGPLKKVHPNKLDITAAGHLMAGEAVEAGVRELNEELGLEKTYADLVPLGIRPETEVIG